MFRPASTKPLHVVVVPSSVGTPGDLLVERFFRDQALALQQRGVRTGFVCAGNRSLRDLSWKAARQTHFQVTWEIEEELLTLRLHGWNPAQRTVRGSLIWSRLCANLLERYIRTAGRPDIVHAHCTLWAGHAAQTLLRRHGIPYVITEHSTQFTDTQIDCRRARYIESILSGASRVLAVGSVLAQRLKRYAPHKAITVLPNVVHTDFFTLPPTPSPTHPYRFLTICNLIPRKGVDILLRAFAEGFGGRSDVVLDIGGDGAERVRLEQLAQTLRITQQVTFHGRLERKQVRSLLWKSHAFALASYSETFGVVLIEAMATGLPVVATRCGGPAEIVDSDSGILATPGDVNGLAEALKSVVTHTYSRQTIRSVVVARYSPETISDRLKGIYKAILDAGRP